MAEPPPAHAYPFFKYNIIFFYISQVAAPHFLSLLIQDRLAYISRGLMRAKQVPKMWGGGPYDVLKTTCHAFSQHKPIENRGPIGICDPAWGSEPTAGSGMRAFLASLRVQPFQASLRAISGLECTHKGHMDSTEKSPYVVPSGNSGRHARARPAKTLQEY